MPIYLLCLAVYWFLFWVLPRILPFEPPDRRQYLNNVFFTHFWTIISVFIISWFCWSIAMLDQPDNQELSKPIVTITKEE